MRMFGTSVILFWIECLDQFSSVGVTGAKPKPERIFSCVVKTEGIMVDVEHHDRLDVAFGIQEDHGHDIVRHASTDRPLLRWLMYPDKVHDCRGWERLLSERDAFSFEQEGTGRKVSGRDLLWNHRGKMLPGILRLIGVTSSEIHHEI